METLRAINRNLAFRVNASTGQLLCYGLALLIMVVGIRKVSAMEPTETNLVLGIMLVLILTVQVIIMGTIVGLHARKP